MLRYEVLTLFRNQVLTLLRYWVLNLLRREVLTFTGFSTDTANELFEEYLAGLNFTSEVIDLYSEIVKDTFKVKEGDQEKAMDDLRKQINTIQSRINSTEDKYIADKFDDKEYKVIKDRYLKQKGDLKLDLQLISSKKNNLTEYLDYNVSLIKNLDWFYSITNVNDKQLLLGSIFSEKLVFDKRKYRTMKPNSVISLLLNVRDNFEDIKREKVGNKTNLSNLAPHLGLEPRTL